MNTKMKKSENIDSEVGLKNFILLNSKPSDSIKANEEQPKEKIEGCGLCKIVGGEG